MVAVIEIADAGDARVGDFYRLNDPELRRLREAPAGDAEAAEVGLFVAEGTLVIRQLLRSRYLVRSFLLTRKGLIALKRELEGYDAPVYLASPETMRSITGFDFHRGALACAARQPPEGLGAVARHAHLLVVAEGVNDNENLGALFRNAAAFGADGVVLDQACADPLYRRSIRVSMGQALRLPFARVPSAAEAVGQLRAMGFEVLALTPAADADDIADSVVEGRQALLVGAEGPGLTEAALAAADRRVRIPMAAGVDSLNVATAAAVVLNHLARTR